MSDAIGDRVVILDDSDAPVLELLRFAPALTASAGFEVALRRRVQRLKHFQHASFGQAPAVEYAGDERRLALLSAYTPGVRLSDVVADAQGPAFACSLVQHVAPALSALHRYDGGIGHGALTASRIVISNVGRPIVVEHVLGSALDRLQLSPKRMLDDLGIPAPAAAPQAPVRIDMSTDLFQLGLIALSLLLGRPLTVDECGNARGPLNQALAGWDDESAVRFLWLRMWLERALQIEQRGFSSFDEAYASVPAIADKAVDDIARLWRGLLRSRRMPAIDRVEMRPEATSEPPAAPEPGAAPIPVLALEAAPTLEDVAALPEFASEDPGPVAAVEASAIPEPRKPPPAEPTAFFATREPTLIPLTSAAWTRRSTFPTWAVAALACLAIAEASVIAILLVQRRSSAPSPAVAAINLETAVPGALVMMDGRLLGETPLRVQIGPDVRSISLQNQPPEVRTQEAVVGSTGQERTPLTGTQPGTVADPPAPQRVGGIRVSSSIPLEVFEGDARLGSSATGIISARAGRRELDLVNSMLGFRTRQVVDIKGGQVVPVTVTPPDGRLNINAFPWAEVLIDGKPVGETPIGNLSISLGEHEILFRHPQLGEQRRTVVVRADGVTRVSANLER